MTDANTFQIVVRNTGSADAAIDQVIINGRFIGAPMPPIPLEVGEQTTITITVENSPPPGITVEIALHSAAGKIYPTAVVAILETGTGPWNAGEVTVEEAGGGGTTINRQ